MDKILMPFASEGGSLEEVAKPLINKFYEIGGIVIPVVISVAAILIIIKLIMLGMKLAQSGDDPEERSRIIKGMIWWGVGLLVCLVAVISIATIFNLLKDNATQIEPEARMLCMFSDC